MKAAIITYSNAQNYGAQLQAYALTRRIRELGHEASLIEYREFDTRWFKPRKTISDSWATLIRSGQCKERVQNYIAFRNDCLQRTKLCTSSDELKALNSEYDIFISGSDQVWNCNGRVNKDFFLRFVEDGHRKVAYAPSFGSDSIPNECKEEVKEYINDFECISVREKSGAALIKQLTGKEVPVVLDPVFLLEREDWNPILAKAPESEYIFVYTTQVNEKLKDTVQKAYKEIGLPVISTQYIPGCKCKVRKDIGPREFLGLIDGATFVVSTSFHATAFSIIFEKAFCVVPHSQTGARVRDLLCDFGIEKALVEPSFDLHFCRNIVWVNVRKNVDARKRISNEYLCAALQEK